MIILYLLLAVVVGFFIAAIGYYSSDPVKADFLLKCGSTIGTLSAIIVALFIDSWKAKAFPLKLRITTAPVNNTVTDYFEGENGSIFAKYCHHLLVVNDTPHKTVVNCRVWLKSVSHFEHGKWIEKEVIAVPRLMNWAPSEWSNEERTFSTSQVFDLGVTVGGNGGFVLSVNQKLGGNFERIFQVSSTLKFILFLTADNYQGYKEFTVKVVIPVMIEGETVTKSIVSMK